LEQCTVWHGVPRQRFDRDRNLLATTDPPAPLCRTAAASAQRCCTAMEPQCDTSTAVELKPHNLRREAALPMIDNKRMEKIVRHLKITTPQPWSTGPVTRRTAITAFGVAMMMVNLSSSAISQSRPQPIEGATTMGQYAMSEKTLSDAVGVGGLLVVAQWEAKEGQADKVAEILRHFLPEAQNDPGAKLFLISRNKENPAQFMFYELFVDEAALKAHQESAYFKTYIAGQALPLLAKRERAQYALL
jgi:quinol monooxygenase YgiN